ncbi:MAG: class I SAM-dependent methyltransferase [Hyphomicrobiales bacterium]
MKLLNSMMSRFIKVGTMRVIDADGNEHVYAGEPGPEVTLRITDPKLYTSLFLNPELRAGEAYMNGTLQIVDGGIRDLLKVFAVNRSNLRDQPMQKLVRGTYKKIRKLHQRNTVDASKQNVSHHYDLSNDLYRLFLDEDMHYSCAYFRTLEDTLAEAQQNKLQHIASKLDLKPGQRVLDIGSGWGGMAMYLAAAEDVEVTGVTLSTEQQQLATQRAKERGLSDRVRFELIDYREVQGPFDRIVSVGMFEHVGVQQFPAFFGQISELLADDGVALLHSIGRKGGKGTTGAWVRKYIFPGGYSPALSETLDAVEQSGLWVNDIEILRLHYADTLLAWENNFQENRDKIAEMLDARFCRMWEFYLIMSEFTFRHGKHMVFQMQLTKDVNTLPITRDYMFAREEELEQKKRAK